MKQVAKKDTVEGRVRNTIFGRVGRDTYLMAGEDSSCVRASQVSEAHRAMNVLFSPWLLRV